MRPRSEPPDPLPTLAGTTLAAGALALAAACGAQAGPPAGDPLPPCEWCGATEAPAELDWRTTIAGEDEPGERLVLRGVVYEPDGVTPAPDVVLYVYHTNAEGLYEKRGDETGNGRRHGYLRSWIRTDARGRYEISSIRPGHYPSRNDAAHIHMTVLEPDGTPEYWLPTFFFAGDPYLDEDGTDGFVLDPERDADGVWRAQQDIVLPENPEGRMWLGAADGTPAGAGVAARPAATGGARAVLCVDTARSVVRWRGHKVVGSSRQGTLRLAPGRLRVEDGALAGGEVTVDMRTLAITGIPAHEAEAIRILTEHLSHEEFFGVDRFPVARLSITAVEPPARAASAVSSPAARRPLAPGTYRVTGDLAIRDSVHAVTFPAEVAVEGGEARAVANLTLDRRRWGVEFDGATSTLRNVLVRDDFDLAVGIVASAAACGRGGQ